MDFTEKTINKVAIYNGKIINVELENVLLPNGNESVREIVRHAGVSAIVIYDENRLVLVKQYRKAVDNYLFEIPAGKIEKNEDPIDAAIRELEEETGYKADALELISKFYSSPGFTDEIIYIFLARNVLKGNEKRDDDEFIEVYKVTINEALEMIINGEIQDAKTIIAVNYLHLELLKKA